MKIDKEFNGLVKEDFRYVFNGDIETTECLEVDLDMGLFVTGSIKAGGDIEAGRSIEAGEYIEASKYIEAGGSIIAGWSINAGGSIKVSGSINASGYIKAGGFIKAGWSIKAGEYIEAGRSIKAGGSIIASGFIKAGGSIEANWDIEAGGLFGIVAGLSITCNGTLSFGLKAFAGICSWKEVTEEEKTIACGKLEGGVIEYGILKQTGIEENVQSEMIK